MRAVIINRVALPRSYRGTYCIGATGRAAVQEPTEAAFPSIKLPESLCQLMHTVDLSKESGQAVYMFLRRPELLKWDP